MTTAGNRRLLRQEQVKALLKDMESIGILKDNVMYLETIPNTDGSPIKYRVINGQHRYHALTQYFNCHKTPEEDRTYDCKIWSGLSNADRLFLAANPDQQIWPDDSITVMRNIREILIVLPDAKIDYIQKIMSNKSGKGAVGQMRSAMKFPIGGCAVTPGLSDPQHEMQRGDCTQFMSEVNGKEKTKYEKPSIKGGFPTNASWYCYAGPLPSPLGLGIRLRPSLWPDQVDSVDQNLMAQHLPIGEIGDTARKLSDVLEWHIVNPNSFFSTSYTRVYTHLCNGINRYLSQEQILGILKKMKTEVEELTEIKKNLEIAEKEDSTASSNELKKVNSDLDKLQGKHESILTNIPKALEVVHEYLQAEDLELPSEFGENALIMVNSLTLSEIWFLLPKILGQAAFKLFGKKLSSQTRKQGLTEIWKAFFKEHQTSKKVAKFFSNSEEQLPNLNAQVASRRTIIPVLTLSHPDDERLEYRGFDMCVFEYLSKMARAIPSERPNIIFGDLPVSDFYLF